MNFPIDEIARIEGEGIRLTSKGDWAGARARFEEALTHDMSAFRRASIIRNVAGTFAKEGYKEATAASVQRAMQVLDEAGVQAPELRADLQGIAATWGGQLPVGTFWYGIVFIAGLYWGISVASGAHLERSTVWLAPPGICFLFSFIKWNGFNRVWFVTGSTLYAGFLFAYAIGYSLAQSGILRFSYN